MKISNRKRILITGGCGFIGSHLSQRLVNEGNDVLCVDNLFSGTRENIERLLNAPNFEFLRHDITFPLHAEVDEIYNLACPASPIHYQRDPVQTTKTCVHGSINMLGLAKRTGATILQASTSEVYGDPEIHPQNEAYWGHVNPIGPRSCYDEGKQCAETLFNDYHRQHRINTKIVRIFNTYGPNMHPNDGRVISNFIMQALENRPLTIYGDGSQTRSFCFIDDLIEGMVRMMQNNTQELGPINLGNPNETTILDVAELIIELCESKSPIEMVELPIDDPTRRRPDIAKAEEHLNWSAKTDLVHGLTRTISYFKQRFI